MNGQYFQREVGDWVINIMWIYRDKEQGYIANVIMPEQKQVFGNQLFKTRAQALNFIKGEIDKYKKQCADGEKCLGEMIDDIIFDMQKGEEENAD